MYQKHIFSVNHNRVTDFNMQFQNINAITSNGYSCKRQAIINWTMYSFSFLALVKESF